MTAAHQPEVPESSHHTPSAGHREEVVMTPSVRASPARTVLSTTVSGVEWDRLMARLREFQESKPRTFDGEKPNY